MKVVFCAALFLALCVSWSSAVGSCDLGPDVGPCKARLPRFYYDGADRKCKVFYYGGCGGNANNFQSPKDCSDSCGIPVRITRGDYGRITRDVAAPAVDACNQGADPGPCRGSFPRYYFDSASGNCKRFTYGGCKGNSNNFKTQDECHSSCAAPVDVPQNDAAPAVDACSQGADPGPCRGYFPRYYFDSASGKCKLFGYGGCKGNSNNFQTQDECHSSCAAPVDVPQNDAASAVDACSQGADPGPCRGYFPRYYFDSTSGKCKLFGYGGCKGNFNNFKTQDECHSSCAAPVDVPESACDQPIKSGPCRGRFMRYGYDKTSGKCKPFTYGGCKGNINRFTSRPACEAACVNTVG